jgi:hypothetical protein
MALQLQNILASKRGWGRKINRNKLIDRCAIAIAQG